MLSRRQLEGLVEDLGCRAEEKPLAAFCADALWHAGRLLFIVNRLLAWRRHPYEPCFYHLPRHLILGMFGMIYCGISMDSSDAKANWIEQACNTLAQAAFLLAMVLAYLK